MQCQYIFKQGKRKGQQCPKQNAHAEFCYQHSDEAKQYKKAYNIGNKQRAKEYSKEYREANKDKIREDKKAYAANNKDKLLAYKEANKDKIKEQRKKYNEAHKEHNKEYASDHWQKVLVKTNKHRDKKFGREFNLDEDWINYMLKEQDEDCYHCGIMLYLGNGERLPDQVSVDRVDNSLGHLKGNVVLSCWSCNAKKNDRTFEAFGSSLDKVLKP